MKENCSEKKKGMREQMPIVAAWVDELRATLGAEMVDGAIAASQQAARRMRQMQLEQAGGRKGMAAAPAVAGGLLLRRRGRAHGRREEVMQCN